MTDDRRGKNVSILGAIFQMVLAGVMVVIWLFTGSAAAMACIWLLAGGVPLWLMVAMLFYCRQLKRIEEIELEEIATAGGDSRTIFQQSQTPDQQPAAARLAWMHRWMAPIFTFGWAGYNIVVAIMLSRHLIGRVPQELDHTAQGVLFGLVIAFLGFLLGRYASGMSKDANWRLLRPVGSYLLLGVVFVIAVLAALGAAHYGNMRVDLLVAWFVPIVQLTLATELIVMFVLELYRPRVAGQETRPSFDSRLLSLLAEPSRVGHSIAETINYQFGFEVSGSWFYQLLARALVPLVVFGAIVLIGMTSIVIVRQGQQYVVLRWGRADPQRGVLTAGLRFKLPWPIETAERFNVAKIHEIVLGVEHEEDHGHEENHDVTITSGTFKGRRMALWTAKHGQHEELDFLVAIPPTLRDAAQLDEKQPPPVSIIKLVVPVQYRIVDVYKYGYKFADARKLLECIAFREMVRYCASATLKSPVPGGAPNRPEAIMTYGRRRAAGELKRRIQEAADEMGIGVEIVFTGLLGVHPPHEVAPEFEKVLEAERRQDEKRYRAEAKANEMLAKVAGDPTSALELALAIRVVGELELLDDLVGKDEDLRDELDNRIQAVRKDIAAADEGIRRERLLGKAGASGASPYQRMKRRYVDYLVVLEEINADPSGDRREQLAKARRDATELFDRAAGKPATLVAAAQGDRWRAQLGERARNESFRSDLVAYDHNPKAYMFDRWMDVWDEVLPGISKYVLAVDPNSVEIWLNLENEKVPMGDVTFKSQDAVRN